MAFPRYVKTKKIGDDLTSLAAGKIDAQVLYLVDEKVALEAERDSAQRLSGYANDYSTYSQVYFARSDFLRDHPAILAKFLRATNRGWRRPLPIQTKPRPCSSPGIFPEKTRITRFVR